MYLIRHLYDTLNKPLITLGLLEVCAGKEGALIV